MIVIKRIGGSSIYLNQFCNKLALNVRLDIARQGPPGPTVSISTAPGNTLTLGPDNGLFVQQVWSGTPAW